nr:YdeA protein [Salmonella sp. NCTC 7297]
MSRCTAPTCVPPAGVWKRQAGCIPSGHPNLQLVVELTDAGRELAAPLLAVEQERELAERRRDGEQGSPWSRSGRWIPVTSGQAIGRSGWTTSGTWHAGAIMSSAPTEPPACSCGIRPDR